MLPLPSLRRDEALQRAALISVRRYDIVVDLTAMVAGSDFRAVSTVHFGCTAPGGSTFIDAALEVVSATLNGVAVDAGQISPGRIELTNLAGDNVLVVETVQAETAAGEWVHKSVDASDDEVYVWTSFEPDDARRAWACFDQPDLKAPVALTVLAPAAWTVVSNSPDPLVTQIDINTRQWRFPDTPPLSTYLPVICAGPFYELRSARGGYDLGLFCRRSLAQFLDRDAEELFEVTGQGLAFFAEKFSFPFPQAKYDQVFLPDMGGAMENYGCVTWSDAFVYRSAPTYYERERRASILLHEMAHMWFGDIVTMRWWEDLWLNEAFADWACFWAAEAATEFRHAWSTFLVDDKLWGYAADMAPSTHPIRQPVDDVAAAVASFDGITYPKGASALKQLFALVGPDACVAGLRGYFAKYAWSNTELSDLVHELELASGRDLASWTDGWLDTAGTDRLVLDADGADLVVRAAGPNGGPPRPHRINIGVYDRRPDDNAGLVRRDVVRLETAGATTSVPAGATVGASLLLLNDDDLTFASVRPDPASLRVMLDSAGQLPAAVSRAVAATTAWDMLVYGELAADDFLRCVLPVVAGEPVDSLVEPLLTLAVEAADAWSPDALRERLLAEVADVCIGLSANPLRRTVGVRALTATATTGAQIDAMRSLVGDDIDLRWRALTRLAELELADASDVDSLAAQDPDPDVWVRVFIVDSARPDPAKKEAAWKAIVDEHKVPMGALGQVSTAFWRRTQSNLLAPYAQRFLDLLPILHLRGMIPALAVSTALYPRAGVDADFASKAVVAARAETVSPGVTGTVVELTDKLNRMLKARAR